MVSAYLFNEVIDGRGAAVHLRDVNLAAPIGNARFAWKESGDAARTHTPPRASSHC